MKFINSQYLVLKLRNVYAHLFYGSPSTVRKQEIYLLSALGTNKQEDLTSPYIGVLILEVRDKYNAKYAK